MSGFQCYTATATRVNFGVPWIGGARPCASPDSDAGVVGHAARHDGLGPLDDALVLRRLGDAGACCGHTHNRLLLRDTTWDWTERAVPASIFQSIANFRYCT